MKKIMISLLIVLWCCCLFLGSCSSCGSTLEYPKDDDSDTLCPDPPTGLVVGLQPMGDFSQKEARQLEEELEKHVFSVYGIASGCIDTVMKMPISCYYAPRKRYWADKLLKHIRSEFDITIGLTHHDISAPVHGHYNYGIMGLSFSQVRLVWSLLIG